MCGVYACSIAAILMKSIGVLIFDASPVLRWAIWLCMYWRKVRPDHLPIFMIVVSSAPVSFKAMAPPARREWAPTRSASMPLLWSLRALTACRRPSIMCLLVICVHVLVCLSQTSHMRFAVEPQLLMMWCTLCARALTGQLSFVIAWWWMVCPIRPFF